MEAVSFDGSIAAPIDHTLNGLWFLIQGDQLVLARDGDNVRVVDALDVNALGFPIVRFQFLGRLSRDGECLNCFSAELDGSGSLPDGYVAMDLRQLFEPLDAVTFGVAGRAKQIVAWDRDHQYCGRCATRMESMEGERAKRCPACGLSNYPRISPAVIVAITRQYDDGKRILLARNHRFPAGRYSVVAGFVEPGETLEDCVRREVGEETGIAVDNIRYFGSQPWPFPNSLMVGFTADYSGGEIRLEESEIADAQWFAADALPGLPPKISIARRLIDHFVAQQGELGRQ